MLKATKALFDDFNTDKNLHLLRTAGAGHAKRMGELSCKAVSCLHQKLFLSIKNAPERTTLNVALQVWTQRR